MKGWPAVTSQLFPPSLSDGEVHLCSVELPENSTDFDFASWLSEHERQRAGRFATATLANRFVYARSFLRAVLGSYLEVHPKDVAFSYGPKGKPELICPGKSGLLSFSFSTSRAMAICAVTLKGPIGVDIEQWRPLEQMENIVGLVFSSEECDRFKSHPEEERPIAFFNAWTKKEALVKATGDGVFRGFDTFSVSFSHDKKDFVRVADKSRDFVVFSVWNVGAIEGYTVGLAVDSSNFPAGHQPVVVNYKLGSVMDLPYTKLM